MIFDILKIAFGSLRKKKLRSWLTILGIFIGIMAVVSLISLGEGFQEAIEGQISDATANKIFIYLKGNMAGGGQVLSKPLFEDEKEATTQVPNVQDAIGLFYKYHKGEYRDVKFTIPILVNEADDLSKDVLAEIGYEIIEGNNLREGDTKSVVLGNLYTRREIDNHIIKIGDYIEINNEKLRVVGFFDTIGNDGEDSIAYITDKAYEKVFDEKFDEYTQIVARVKDYNKVDKTERLLEEKLRRERDLPRDKYDFEILTAEKTLEQFNNILSIVQILVIGVAAISIIVGSIGILNTMYTSVLERTKEIGIMKAIGARNSQIFLTFFFESGFLGIVGGLIGVIIGLLVTYGVVQVTSLLFGSSYLVFVFNPILIVGSIIFSFIVGAISGTLPAVQAAKQNPVDCLRYE